MLLSPGTQSYRQIHLNVKELKDNLEPYAVADFLLGHVIVNMKTLD
jgi:hypothetical protein